MNKDALKRYFYWINERHRIYLKKEQGLPKPWTDDPILQRYKFTNPFRENDRVTKWMRRNWTGPYDTRPNPEILFNVCFFRMFGTPEFAEANGWNHHWNPGLTKHIASERLARKEKVFTGAYIITNQGLTLPKQEVVADLFLTPIWENRHDITANILIHNSLQAAHQILGQYRGWGGGGFMAYEVVTDLNYTPLLKSAIDKRTWANAGPGAIRGLNRLHDRPLEKAMKQDKANVEMRALLDVSWDYLEKHIPDEIVDMRMVEHSLCEWDKYERVRLGQGKPRSTYPGV